MIYIAMAQNYKRSTIHLSICWWFSIEIISLEVTFEPYFQMNLHIVHLDLIVADKSRHALDPQTWYAWGLIESLHIYIYIPRLYHTQIIPTIIVRPNVLYGVYMLTFLEIFNEVSHLESYQDALPVSNPASYMAVCISGGIWGGPQFWDIQTFDSVAHV